MSWSMTRPLIRMATALVAFVAMPTTALAQVAFVSCGVINSDHPNIYRISFTNIDQWDSRELEYRSACDPRTWETGSAFEGATCSVSSETVSWTWSHVDNELTYGWLINRRTGYYNGDFVSRTGRTDDHGRCTLAEDPSLQVRPQF